MSVVFSITYGLDQKILIEELLTEFVGTGHVLNYEAVTEGEYLHYVIVFSDIFSVYLFGHAQGKGLFPHSYR